MLEEFLPRAIWASTTDNSFKFPHTSSRTVSSSDDISTSSTSPGLALQRDGGSSSTLQLGCRTTTQVSTCTRKRKSTSRPSSSSLAPQRCLPQRRSPPPPHPLRRRRQPLHIQRLATPLSHTSYRPPHSTSSYQSLSPLTSLQTST